MSMGAMGEYRITFDGGYGHPLFTAGGKTAMDTAMIFTKAGFPATAHQWFAGNWTPLPRPPSSSEGSERLPHPHTGGREAVIEECAKVVEAHQSYFPRQNLDRYDEGAGIALWTAAAAIRALSLPLQKTQKETA